MRADNKMYWNLFQRLFTEATTCYQKCGQQTKAVTESKSALQEKGGARRWAGRYEIAGTYWAVKSYHLS